MSRLFCIPGVVLLFCALVLSFLASISLPYLPALDVARVRYVNGTALDNSSVPITEYRFGIWSACSYNVNEDRTCLRAGAAYDVTVSTSGDSEEVTIGASWTRGLAVQPVATAITLIALCLSLSQHLLVVLLASLASFLAALLHLISFAIQIALFARVRNEMNKLELGASTRPGPGFWLVFVSLILTLLAGCIVCFGRRRDRRNSAPARAPVTPARAEKAANDPDPASKPGFFSRFRKN